MEIPTSWPLVSRVRDGGGPSIPFLPTLYFVLVREDVVKGMVMKTERFQRETTQIAVVVKVVKVVKLCHNPLLP